MRFKHKVAFTVLKTVNTLSSFLFAFFKNYVQWILISYKAKRPQETAPYGKATSLTTIR